MPRPEVHPPGCDCGAYACELRAKGVMISEVAIPNRVSNRPIPVRTEEQFQNNLATSKSSPSWESGRLMHKGLPVLNPDGTHVRMKQYVQNRKRIDETLRRKSQGGAGPHP